jgi:hypothetical protein
MPKAHPTTSHTRFCHCRLNNSLVQLGKVDQVHNKDLLLSESILREEN